MLSHGLSKVFLAVMSWKCTYIYPDRIHNSARTGIQAVACFFLSSSSAHALIFLVVVEVYMALLDTHHTEFLTYMVHGGICHKNITECAVSVGNSIIDFSSFYYDLYAPLPQE